MKTVETEDAISSGISTAEAYTLRDEPYYLPIADEVEVFLAAYEAHLPVLLKGPTGCGKTRFVEYMAHLLYRQHNHASEDRRTVTNPLVTVACHEDLSASDLVGRYLLIGEETIWMDGPLTHAVHTGAICYLDEIVEARKDTTVLIHSLTDHRRILPIEKRGITLEAHQNFILVISYNPGYQSVLKDLKPSTRQRFVSLEFDYPLQEQETKIIAHESSVDLTIAADLATLGAKVRHLRQHGFEEGVSTRLLVYAGLLMARGINPRRACDVAICRAITDDADVQRAVAELVSTLFP
ncbi:MAG: CbbQ/NirQ/NorQ/GpvN family protein [bacterium]|nr:CbbQ/NirQ/NorQ/GpvN family protein [bacterium]